MTKASPSSIMPQSMKRCRIIDRFIPLLSASLIAGLLSVSTNAVKVEAAEQKSKGSPELQKLFETMALDESIDSSWMNLVTVVTRNSYQLSFRQLVKENKASDQPAIESARQKAQDKAKKAAEYFAYKLEKKYKEELRAIYTQVYSKYYSASDMKALAAFYGSEAGKKAMAENPAIIRRSMIKLVRKVKPRAEKLLAKRLKEMMETEGGSSSIEDEILE